MDSEHGSGSSKHPRIREEDIVNLDDSFQPSNSVDFDEHSGGSRTISETTRSEVGPSTTENSESSNSVASSLSEYCYDNFFQVDMDHSLPPKSQENSKPSLRDERNDVHSGPLSQLEEIFGSSHSTTRASYVAHEPFIPVLSPTKSPPIQAMERPRGYDPDRIPACVFTQSPSPMDWSVASNESLFSIQIGNLSFSRDHNFYVAGEANKPNEIGKSGELYVSRDLHRSGELDKSSELYRSGELKDSSELIKFIQPSALTRGGEPKPQNFDLGKTGAFEKPAERYESETNRHGTNCHLDETKTEIRSMTSPMKKKPSKSACICTDCSCGFCSSCSFRCPSCTFRCPSCCCRRTCCSCKCLSWPSCSCNWSCLPSFSCKWRSCFSCCCNCPSGCSKPLT